MKTRFFALGACVLSASCLITFDGDHMPITDDHHMVAAITPLPAEIFSEVEVPDDGSEPAAMDIERVAQTMLTNDAVINERIIELNPLSAISAGDGGVVADFEFISVNSVMPTFSAFTGVSVDITDAKAGETLIVMASGQVLMKADGGVGAAVDYGHIALFVTDDFGGAGSPVYVGGSTRQIDSRVDPVHHVNFVMHTRHVVSVDGTTHFDLRASVESGADEMVMRVHEIVVLHANAT